MLGIIIKGFRDNTLLVLLTIIVSVCHLTPIIYDGYKILTIASWMLFILYYVASSKYGASKYTKGLLTVGVLFIVQGIIYSISGISSGKIMRDMIYSLFIFPIMCLVLIDAKITYNNARLMFHVIAFVAAANIVDNIRLSYIYPYICMMSEEVLEQNGLTGLNVGGSPFISMAVFYLIIVMIAFLKSTNKIERIIFAIYSVIALWFIVFCSFKASSVIYAMISVMALLVLNRSRNPKRALVKIGIAFLVLSLFITPLIHLLVDIIGDSRIGSRLLVFADDSEIDSNSNSVESRMELWLVSIKTWLSSPSSFMFGIGDHKTADIVGSTAATGIGNHSDFFDVLARYGLIGGFFMYSIIKKLYEYVNSIVEERERMHILVFFVILVLFGFTKKILLPSISIMMFVLLPIYIHYKKMNDHA